jgi:hypothetical protein
MGFRLFLLTLFFLPAALEGSAQQRHSRRHGHHEQHISRLPDSVSTSDEEIRPFTPDTVTSSNSTQSKDAIIEGPPKVDSIQNTYQAADSTSSEEPEPTPELRSIPDSAIRAWKGSHDFDYANDPSLWKVEPPEEENFLLRFLNSSGFRYFIYVLLGCVLLYALYRIIAENNLRFFYRKPVRLKETPLTEAELPEEDLDQLLKKALEAKEYRMATRLLYLKTLRHLDARQLIRWHSQSTDEEYVRQMATRPEGERFRWLTSAYERVWYGKFNLDDHQFARLSQHFQDFHNIVDHS